MLRAMAICAIVLSMVGGCGQGAPNPPAASQTQRQRDSVLGASRLPGAQGVRGALGVSDSAAARRAREDATSQ